jgi:hypothetical protein
MTLYFIIAIVALLGVIVFLIMDRRSTRQALSDLTADKMKLLANVAALKQNAIDNETIAAWKKEQEAKIEAGKADEVVADIVAGNNARLRNGKTH